MARIRRPGEDAPVAPPPKANSGGGGGGGNNKNKKKGNNHGGGGGGGGDSASSVTSDAPLTVIAAAAQNPKAWYRAQLAAAGINLSSPVIADFFEQRAEDFERGWAQYKIMNPTATFEQYLAIQPWVSTPGGFGAFVQGELDRNMPTAAADPGAWLRGDLQALGFDPFGTLGAALSNYLIDPFVAGWESFQANPANSAKTFRDYLSTQPWMQPKPAGGPTMASARGGDGGYARAGTSNPLNASTLSASLTPQPLPNPFTMPLTTQAAQPRGGDGGSPVNPTAGSAAVAPPPLPQLTLPPPPPQSNPFVAQPAVTPAPAAPRGGDGGNSGLPPTAGPANVAAPLPPLAPPLPPLTTQTAQPRGGDGGNAAAGVSNPFAGSAAVGQTPAQPAPPRGGDGTPLGTITQPVPTTQQPGSANPLLDYAQSVLDRLTPQQRGIYSPGKDRSSSRWSVYF